MVNEKKNPIFVTVNSAVGIETLEENGFLIYPNPTKEKLSLEFMSIKDRQMCIFELTGRTVLMKTLRRKNEIIDLSSFEKGIYIISTKDDDKTLIARIVKEQELI